MNTSNHFSDNPISSRLFPNRDLIKEWQDSKSSKQLPAFLPLPLKIDLASLQRKTMEALGDKENFQTDFVAEAFSESVVEARPEDYCFGLISQLCGHAKEIQHEINQRRGVDWRIHQAGLSTKAIVRALRTLDINYNPVIDERNYHVLPSWALNSEIERITELFKARCVRLRFTQLGPGDSVKPHLDSDARYCLRILIPVFSNPLASYGAFVDGQPKIWSLHEGAVYFVNGGYVHWARNEGNTRRIALVMSLDGQADLPWIEEVSRHAS